MDEHIYFSCKCNGHKVKGNTVLTKDGSMIYETPTVIGGFSFYPYHWSFEITTQIIASGSYKLCYAMGFLCTDNCIETQLDIPEAVSGEVFLNVNFEPNDGIYYNEFSAFVCCKYYDAHQKILAVGDICSKGQCIEFADGQFVVLNDKKELVAVYVIIT